MSVDKAESRSMGHLGPSPNSWQRSAAMAAISRCVVSVLGHAHGNTMP